MSLRVERLTGSALADAVPELARLRMTVFRDWPYLYDGTLAYEQHYLATFSAASGAVVVAAYDADAMIGAATAAPLLGSAAEFAEPFLARGDDPEKIFYFGESVLLQAYRGQGLGHAFFDHREGHARSFGRFTLAAFCAVQRPAAHPFRPQDYVPLDAFWRKRGFEMADGLTTSFSWKDIDQPDETAKPMQFWIKALDP
ncbi:MAG: GNAT family N-acetyltransferase [Hyphomicrobiaceae bacterium]